MRQIQKGSTNVSVELYIIDDTDGTPETGVLYNTSGIDLNYRRDGAAVTSITEADLTTPALTDAHEDGGFLEVANGRYRLDVPDAAFASGVSQVTIGGTVTGMIVIPITIQLVDFDPEDATRLGLTALPNAAADAAGGLPISDAGGLDMDSISTHSAADVWTAAGRALSDPAGFKKNTAVTNFMFFMADSTDGRTPKTGASVTATRSLDGATYAACVNSATEVANGMYKIDLDAADMNGDLVSLRFTATGADDRNITILTET